MLFGALALAGVSCKHNKLDNVDLIKTTDRSISGDGIVTDGITKDNETVKVPFKILLSAPATKAFQVGVSFNTDTVTQLIANGTLKDAVIIPASFVDFPSVVNVAFGSDNGTGIATIRLSAIEKNYGKTVAFAFKLSNPGKGNQIKGGSSNILVVINTAELIKPEEIHYLSIFHGGDTVDNVVYQKGYVSDIAGITIPLTINLAGIPGSAFNVKVKLNTDTIPALIQSNVLPANAIALKPTQFFLDSNVRINSNSSTGQIRLKIEWPVFDANIVANKKFAFVISLSAPTKHILHPTKYKIIVVVDPNVNLDNNSYITGNGTGLKTEYFSDNQLLDFDGRKPTLVRIEPSINWQNDGQWQDATPGISHDNFSTRWTGEFLAPVRGDYIFYQDHWDDGSRLWINGVAVINDFTTQWDRPERKVTYHMERGVRYKIEADHRENVGGQRAILDYEVPSVGISRRNVPQSQLFPAQ